MEKGLQPLRSVTDYFTEVKQLEEESGAIEERLEKIQKAQLNGTEVKSKPREPIKHSGFSTSESSTANTPQNYEIISKQEPTRGCGFCSDSTQDNLKGSDPDLSRQ